MQNAQKRENIIIKTSIIGIVTNVLLSIFKIIVGTISNSIAIILDAVNNLSDAASSIITIVGAKLAGKSPDKKHPFGYGRVEYLSALIISMIILYAGITSFRESIIKVLHPEEVNYTLPTLIIVAVAVLVKIIIGNYVKSVGEKINSDSLINSGEDARLDSFISASTLVAAIIFIFTKVSLEAYLGIIISVVIIKSGFNMVRDTMSSILGESVNADFAKKIKAAIMQYEEVQGVYDLVINDYGPDKWTGSVHIEVFDTLEANEIDKLTRKITYEIFKQYNVVLTAIGVYSLNTKDEKIKRIREDVLKIIFSHEYVIQVHGFYYDETEKNMLFDVVISLNASDREKVFSEIIEDVKNHYPDTTITSALDTNFVEE